MAKVSAKSAAPAASPASRPLKKGDHIFLVDGSSYIFRAYFAMFAAAQKSGKKLTRSDGLPIGGVLAFSNMLFKLLREGFDEVKPTHIAVVFDYSEKTFRNEIYPAYKGHRPDPPDELIPQFPLMREVVRAFGLLPIEQRGFEADDIIATYAREAVEAGADATIVAGDKDLMQLVRPGVRMFDPMPGRERPIGRDEVIEKFGVPPEKVPEVQALIGDSTDNVPGVPGIGVKTAALLINEFGDLETLLARASEIKQEKRRQALKLAEARPARRRPMPPMPPMPTTTGELFPETLPRRKPGNDNVSFAPEALVIGRRAEIAAAEIEHARYATISDIAALDRWIA